MAAGQYVSAAVVVISVAVVVTLEREDDDDDLLLRLVLERPMTENDDDSIIPEKQIKPMNNNRNMYTPIWIQTISSTIESQIGNYY